MILKYLMIIKILILYLNLYVKFKLKIKYVNSELKDFYLDFQKMILLVIIYLN